MTSGPGTECFWYELGMTFLNRKTTQYKNLKDHHFRDFKGSFGCSPLVMKKCWGLLMTLCELEKGVTPNHLLWALFFLKVYACESTNVALAKCDHKTYRKWSWMIVNAISDLEPHVVRFSLELFFI
jgi:hypothetical protein